MEPPGPGTKASEPESVRSNVVIEALGAGVLTFRPDGTIVQANAMAGRILGRPRELVGARVDDVLCATETLRAGSASSTPGLSVPDTRHQVSVTLPDGATRALGFSTSQFVDPDSGTVHHVVLFQEITALLELRRDRDRLLQFAALGDAMPSILHEIRNPLAAVTSLLEVLVEEQEGKLQEDLHVVLCEVRRMGLGLQGIGGLTSSMHARRFSAVDLAVREACRVLEPAAARRGVSLSAVGRDLPLLPIDRGIVSGVVFNLVKNAIDACEPGGHIDVDARVEGEEFVLRVSDDGQGMTPEVAARCCELFFTSKEKGSGIGLALCRQVAESSGGRLSIQSTRGVGTTVEIRVPFHTTPQK